MTNTSQNLNELLENWEEIYKRGLLSFWLLLILHTEDSYPYEMNAKIFDLTQGGVKASEQSIYRALRRFESMGVVTSALQESASGPNRRYYALTATGRELLKRFTQRNISIFQEPDVDQLINSLLNKNISQSKK